MDDAVVVTPSESGDYYRRGVEDYRKERSERRSMHSPDSRDRRPSRDRRSRSRSPMMKRDRSRSRSRDHANRTPKGSVKQPHGKECRVYVRNLPYDMKWMELKDIMKKCGSVEHVEIFTDNDGRSKGCGVVEFTRGDDAARAIKELDGFEIKGRALRLREDIMDDDQYVRQLATLKEKSRSIKEQHKHQQQDPHGGLMDQLGGGGGGGISGLSALLGAQTSQQQMLNMLNSKNVDPINCTVFVSNLDFNINWQNLKDAFRRAGNCIRCDIHEDHERKSKGFGTVVFETPLEALSAIIMFNGLEMGDRKLSVRLDRAAPLTLHLGSMGIQSNQLTQAQLVQLQAYSMLSQMGGAGLGALGGLTGLGALGSLTAAYGGLQAAGQQAAPAAAGLGGLGALGSLSQLLGTGGLTAAGLGAPSYGSSALGSSGLGSSGFGTSGNTASSYSSNYNLATHLSQYSTPASSADRREPPRGNGGGNTAGVKTVFVRNLPFSTTWQDLKDKFRDAGKVIRADVMKDEKGRSKGVGTVEYETADDAQRAVAVMHGSRMDGRELDVRLDRF